MDYCSAISNRQVLKFTYEGHERVVHPAALGQHEGTGSLVLRAYQVEGTSSSGSVPAWKKFTIDKIVGVGVLGSGFENPPDFRPGDSHMAVVHCELK